MRFVLSLLCSFLSCPGGEPHKNEPKKSTGPPERKIQCFFAQSHRTPAEFSAQRAFSKTLNDLDVLSYFCKTYSIKRNDYPRMSIANSGGRRAGSHYYMEYTSPKRYHLMFIKKYQNIPLRIDNSFKKRYLCRQPWPPGKRYILNN